MKTITKILMAWALLGSLMLNAQVSQNKTLNSMQFSDVIPISALTFATPTLYYNTPIENENTVVDARILTFEKHQNILAELLISQTEYGIYNFSSIQCDLDNGGQIFEWFEIEVLNHSFNTCAMTRGNGLEYGVIFSLRIDPSEILSIVNHQNQIDYNTDYSYYNFQIWAKDLMDMKTIVKNIIQINMTNKSSSRIIYSKYDNREKVDMTNVNPLIIKEFYDFRGNLLYSGLINDTMNDAEVIELNELQNKQIIRVIRNQNKIISSEQIMMTAN